MRRSGILFVLAITAILVMSVTAQEKGMATASESSKHAAPAEGGRATSVPWMAAAQAKMESELVGKYGEGQRERARRGLKQVGEFWRVEDGDQGAFETFVRANFAGEAATLDTIFNRFERLMEQIDGHMQEMGREFRTQADLDLGPMLPMDEIFAGYDPSAHVLDDLFQNKLAFVVLLNFPLTTLEQRLSEGQNWTRRQWAEARLAQRFSKRVPAEVNLAIAQASAEADRYISEYNVWMHHVETPSTVDGRRSMAKPASPAGEQRLFPKGMRLLSHWNLRDEIKADYDEPDKALGIAKQRTIQQVMERIVTQTIPEAVVNNPQVDWNPWTNEVKETTDRDSDFLPTNNTSAAKAAQASGPTGAAEAAPLRNTKEEDPHHVAPTAGATRVGQPYGEREPDTRYAMLEKTYLAARKMDPYSPTAPTLMARRFDENREVPEVRVRQMLVEVVSSPLVPQVAALIEKRLGRPLEPFDIWYSGFRPKSKYTEAELDEIVRKKYPTAEAYRKDIPNLLMKLGFAPERAQYVAENIVVDPARGSEHALGSGMRAAKVHLRTRVEKTGMNYKGFNIAVHEMGHNVEQTFSLNDVDHTLLKGVPNTAFTEALAFVFQGHDLELLGLPAPDEKSLAEKTLNDFWATYEIAGVALVDTAAWHWAYDHPNATPAEMRDAVVQISKDIWNRYYASVFHKKDVVLLGVYSHMIDSFLYLPDYPIGHLIAFQIEEQMKKAGTIGPEFERMAKMGDVTPDLWMINATGHPVGPEALLEATDRALKQVAE